MFSRNPRPSAANRLSSGMVYPRVFFQLLIDAGIFHLSRSSLLNFCGGACKTGTGSSAGPRGAYTGGGWRERKKKSKHKTNTCKRKVRDEVFDSCKNWTQCKFPKTRVIVFAFFIFVAYLWGKKWENPKRTLTCLCFGGIMGSTWAGTI